MTAAPLPETNWEESWKDNYPPQEIGDRIVVLPLSLIHILYYVNLYLAQNHSYTAKTAVPGFPRIPLFFVHTELQLGPI